MLTKRLEFGGRGLQAPHEALEPLFRSIKASPDAIFVSDRRNRIIFWNDAARFFFGFTEAEALGADCDQLLAGCDAFGNRYCSKNCPVMQTANRGEIVRNYALTFRSGEKSNLAASVSLMQLRTEAADEYFLLHLIRPSGAEPQAEPPRPGIVTNRETTDARALKLTAREVEVLGMIAAGRNTPDIAERLHISQLTARSHIQNILQKLEVHSKAEAVAFAFQKSLV